MTKGTEIRYRVRGGTPLQGTVFVQGAKNAALKMIAAALLTDKGRTVLRNVPPIEDVRRAVELVQALGARVEFHEAERTLVVAINVPLYQTLTPEQEAYILKNSGSKAIIVSNRAFLCNAPDGCMLNNRTWLMAAGPMNGEESLNCGQASTQHPQVMHRDSG